MRTIVSDMSSFSRVRNRKKTLTMGSRSDVKMPTTAQMHHSLNQLAGTPSSDGGTSAAFDQGRNAAFPNYGPGNSASVLPISR